MGAIFASVFGLTTGHSNDETMKYHLQRYLFLLILLALCLNGHGSFINTASVGYWEVNDITNMRLTWEEESEMEPEDELAAFDDACKIGKGGDEGEEALGFAKPKVNCKPFALATLPAATPDFQTNQAPNAAQARAISLQLLNKPKARLFLLFHNLKSDLAHQAA